MVLGVIAASDSGGGGGSSSGGGTSTPINGIDNSIIVNGADNRTAESLSFPVERILDASSQLNGRTVTGVRVTLNYNSADAGPDTFVVSYGGSTLIDTGPTDTTGSETAEAAGNSPTVTIAVTTSEIPDNRSTYNFTWTATATFFVE